MVVEDEVTPVLRLVYLSQMSEGHDKGCPTEDAVRARPESDAEDTLKVVILVVGYLVNNSGICWGGGSWSECGELFWWLVFAGSRTRSRDWKPAEYSLYYDC